uniref:Gamma-interferon-inducible lysosomal thiol reductase n=1 Tax=Alexandrium andersonii TaxID=327968 RepID=A0A7S2DJD5_9DINO
MLPQVPMWMRCTFGLAFVAIPVPSAAAFGRTTGRLRSNSSQGDEDVLGEFFRQLEDGGAVGTEETVSMVAKPQVSFEFYYLTTCPHCLTLIQHAVRPLIQARLPGDKVRFTILPVLKGMSNREQCMETGACHHALAPLCALRDTLPQPVPADSPELRRAVDFLACDLAFTADGLGNTPEVMQECARKAGLDWEAIDTCTKGPKVFDVMYSTAYAKTIVSAMHRLQKASFAQPPSMPWVFLDGKLLTCGSEGCIAEQTPSGEIALPKPGSLLALVCDKLESKPEACMGVQKSLDPTAVEAEERLAEEARRCENCVEVGHFHWHVGESRMAKQAPQFLALVVLAIVSSGVLLRASSAARSALRLRVSQEERGPGEPGGPLAEDFGLQDARLSPE